MVNLLLLLSKDRFGAYYMNTGPFKRETRIRNQNPESPTLRFFSYVLGSSLKVLCICTCLHETQYLGSRIVR